VWGGAAASIGGRGALGAATQPAKKVMGQRKIEDQRLIIPSLTNRQGVSR
jgi:hypothetical protein